MPVLISATDEVGELIKPSIKAGFVPFFDAASDDVFMTATTFWRAESAFDTHFMYQPLRSVKKYLGIEDDYQYFDWEELRRLADTAGSARRMLLVYLGLDGKELRYGFRFVNYTLGTPWTFSAPDHPSHVLHGGVIADTTVGEWANLKAQYDGHVSVLRTDDPTDRMQAVDANKDARYISLPWEDEVKVMHDYTAPGATHGYRVAINSVSVFSEGVFGVEDPGYYHGVALYLERNRIIGGPVPMLDDSAMSIYKNKAADLGNRCPPRCNEYLKNW